MQPALNLSVATALVLLTGLPIAAQQKNDAGLGTVKRLWDVSNAPLVRDGLIIGVCFLNGKYYVSGRGDGVQRLLYEFDGNGTLLQEIPQPPIAQGTVNGVRDMATDGTNIIGGSAVGLLAFDINGLPVSTLVTVNNPAAPFGPQPITGPAFTALGGIFRGVAFDPGGNSGNGSIWVSNNAVGLDIFEIDLQGNILTQFPNQGWEAYGLARDPTTGNLWVNSLVDPNNPNGGPIFELDVTTGLPTGAQFAQAHTDFHAGIDGVPGGDPGSYISHFDIAAVNQSYADNVAIHRVDLSPHLRGKNEAFLEARLNANPFTTGNLGQFMPGDTLEWRVNPGSGISTGSLGWVVFNIGDAALCDASTTVFFLPGSPLFRELRVGNVLSTPSSVAILIDPIGLSAVSSKSIAIPAGIFDCFDVIRFQGIYIDLDLAVGGDPFPFVATTETFTNHFDETSCSIVVVAEGANSAVGGVPVGFWKVINNSGPDIVEVTLDFLRSTTPSHLNDDARFDLDQTNMADRFDAGNSTDLACLGTYRNGSDVTTGLIYDNLNFTVAPCNVTTPLPNSGFIASQPGAPLFKAYHAITFRFNDFQAGESFVWDADTDGPATNDGASMAGLFVEIKLANGRTLCGELRVDPVTPMRSVAGFK